MLLEGLAAHSLNFDSKRFEEFGNSLKKLGADSEEATDEASVLLIAGFALRMLQEHGEAAGAHYRERLREMREITTLLSAALVDLAAVAPDLQVRMAEIESELADAEQIGPAKARLEEWLAEIRAGAVCRQDEGTAVWPAGGTDPVTGLADADSVSRALGHVWSRRDECYVAVLTLDRLETINLRFGIRAGDQMLQALARRTGEALSGEDRLFRWRGPCLLILMTREAPESHVSIEVSRLANNRSDAPMTFREREAIVPLSASWDLFALSRYRAPDELLRQIGNLTGTRTRSGRRVLAATAV